METWGKKGWDRIFKEKGKVFFEIHEDMPKISKIFSERHAKRVLDLGFGSGRHTVYLAKHGFDVYGLDISSHGIKIAKEDLKKGGLKAHLKIGDIYTKLPYRSRFFDAMVSTHVIHHARIDDIRKLIMEIERILKPGGLIFISVAKGKHVKVMPEEKKWKIKRIAPNTILPLSGEEKGIVHYFFTKRSLRKEFNNFEIYRIWVDSINGHYCMLAEKKSKKM